MMNFHALLKQYNNRRPTTDYIIKDNRRICENTSRSDSRSWTGDNVGEMKNYEKLRLSKFEQSNYVVHFAIADGNFEWYQLESTSARMRCESDAE